MRKVADTKVTVDLLRHDRGLLATPWAAASVAFAAAGPALRGFGENKLLTQLTRNDSPQNLGGALTTFLLAEAFVPQLTRFANAWATRAWQTDALRRYDAAYLANEQARPSLWAMGGQTASATQTVRQVRTNLFAERMRWGVTNEVKAIAELLQAGVGFTYGVLWFGNALGGQASAALFVGVALACGVRLVRFGEESSRTEAARDAEREVGAHRPRAWDNVTLGNPNNQRRWLDAHRTLMNTQHRRQDSERTHKQTSAAAEHLLALFPLGLLMYVQLLHAGCETHQATEMTRGLLTLPAAFRAVKESSNLARLVTAGLLPARKSLLERTLRPAREVPGCNFDDLIDFDNIYLRDKNGERTTLRAAQEELVTAARNNTPGLFEIRGNNGLGKSLFLLKLKELLQPDAAALLPADSSGLSFAPLVGSASELTLHHLDSLLKSDAPVLLLDELEATLDAAARAAIRARLDSVSRTPADGGEGRTVFLVSHV